MYQSVYLRAKIFHSFAVKIFLENLSKIFQKYQSVHCHVCRQLITNEDVVNINPD